MFDPASYRSVAVASTFSPRFEQVLAEAKRIRDRFDAELCLIYVGEKSNETSAKFAGALERLSLPKDSPIHYEQGDPAAAILRAIERNDIDVIVAGTSLFMISLPPFLAAMFAAQYGRRTWVPGQQGVCPSGYNAPPGPGSAGRRRRWDCTTRLAC